MSDNQINLLNSNYTIMLKNTPLVVGIVILVLGLVGLVSNFSVFLMWALVILGVLGILWGWLDKSNGGKK